MRRIALSEWVLLSLVAVTLTSLNCTQSQGGEPPTTKSLDDGVLANILQREGYADSAIKRLLDLPRLTPPLVIPLDESAASALIEQFGTSLSISDNGRWMGVCSLNKFEDSTGWHICMDVTPLYPRAGK